MKSTRQRGLAASAASLLLAFTVALVGALLLSANARAADEDVDIIDFAFVPSNITINVGDTVTWTNTGQAPHTATSQTGLFGSPTLNNGDSYSFTFDTAGTYNYFCEFHANMMGTVVVQQATSTATTTSTSTSTSTATTTTTATSTSSATATPTTATATATPTTVTTTPTSPSTPTTPIAGGQTLTLSGAQEVPPVTNPNATATFQYRLDGNTLTWRLQANGEALTMAHIHFGATGTNGPIVVTLFPLNQAGVSSIDRSGTVSVSNLEGPFAGDLNRFLTELRAGNLYINVHNVAHPAGVVRAQVPASTAGSPTATATATTAPRPPQTGSGIDESGHTGIYLGIFAAAVIVITTSGAATIALRRRG